MREPLLYVGTYTENTASKGVYCFWPDEAGTLLAVGAWDAGPNPSYLAARNGVLYAANELENRASVTACAIGVDGSLERLNSLDIPGAGCCHLSLHPTLPLLFASNFGSGDMVSCSLLPDGRLGEVCDRQQHHGAGPVVEMQAGPHLHSTTPDATGYWLVAADLGNDTLTVYHPAADGRLEEGSVLPLPPGSGPRHFAFHPNNRLAFLANELNNTVTALSFDAANGLLKPLAAYPLLPPDYQGVCHTADLHLSQDGRFLYVSTREYDGITMFYVDANDGRLEKAGQWPTGGRWPRHFSLSPDGRLVAAANQKSDSLAVLCRDNQTGELGEVLDTAAVPGAVCTLWHT